MIYLYELLRLQLLGVTLEFGIRSVSERKVFRISRNKCGEFFNRGVHEVSNVRIRSLITNFDSLLMLLSLLIETSNASNIMHRN